MNMIDPFAANAFTLTELTAAINRAPFRPGRLSELGLFTESGISTTTLVIEEKNGTLSLVQTSPRGSAGQTVTRDKRAARSFVVPHLQQNDRLNADEIINVRAFGQSVGDTINAKRDEALAKMRAQLDLTSEYHRVGALKGVILDADGSTIYDLFSEFGVSQNTLDFALDVTTTDVRSMCFDAQVLIEDELGAAPVTGYRAFCGDTFWKSFTSHKSVTATVLNTQLAASLRGDLREIVTFGGIQWERYRGKYAGTPYIGANDAYIVPEGVPDLFITRFAPADYVETVGSLGLPYYAKAVLDDMQKGYDMEAQSNQVNLCTRPRAIVKATV